MQIDEQLHEETTLKFTEQQIDDYCEKVENLHLSSRPEGRMLFDVVQIIRQLQSVNRDLVQNIVLSAGEQPL